jgi:hypothetical protein
MSTTITARSRPLFAALARREQSGSARTSHQLPSAHLAEQAYTAELAHAERSARMRDREAVLANGSWR